MPQISILNEQIKWIIGNLFCEMLFAIIDTLLFTKLFNLKQKNETKIKMILIYGFLRAISITVIPLPFNRMFNLIFAIVLFFVFFRVRLAKCILGEVINSITIIVTETFLAKILCLLMPAVDTYLTGMYNVRYVCMLKVAVSICRLIIYYIISKRKIVVRLADNLSTKNRNNIIIVSLLVYTVIFLNEFEMLSHIRDYPYSIFVIDIISIIICFGISMKAILEISILEERDLRIIELESYNKTLAIMYDSIRGFRHDFSNFVQALDGYAKINDLDGVRKMSEAIAKECRAVNNMEILDPTIINNPPVYSIITNKYYLAQESDIAISMEVMTDLEIVQDCNYEFCRILGILLDNAIEAAKKVDDKIVNIRIMKLANSKKRVVIIENTYDKTFDIDMAKLFDKGYTSKVDTKNEHGLGLWTVKRILEKNEKLDLYTEKGEMFSQQLEIYE